MTSKPFARSICPKVMLRQVAKNSPTHEGITSLGAVKMVAKMGWDAGTGWFQRFFQTDFWGNDPI